jgi:hypothetical protein
VRAERRQRQAQSKSTTTTTTNNNNNNQQQQQQQQQQPTTTINNNNNNQQQQQQRALPDRTCSGAQVGDKAGRQPLHVDAWGGQGTRDNRADRVRHFQALVTHVR